MKVFAVERGCHLDRYLAAIYSSRELAERDVALRSPNNRWNSAGSVEEYEVDEYARWVKRHLWFVEIDLESGEIFRTSNYDTIADPHLRGDVGEVIDLRHQQTSDLSSGFGRIFQSAHSYESMDHAVKLATEARQARLREKDFSGTQANA